MIKLLYKENASTLLDLYVPENNDGRNAISRMATDFFFYCPSRRAAMALSQITNTYLYLIFILFYFILFNLFCWDYILLRSNNFDLSNIYVFGFSS